jgi:hypothetical protein
MSIAYKNALLGRSINVSGSRDTILVDSNHDVSVVSGVINGSSATLNNISANSISTLNLSINNSGVALSGHQHTIQDIQNLQNTITSLSGIAPANSQSTNNLFLWSNYR